MNLNELVGKRINKVLINETKDILFFILMMNYIT